MNPTQLLLFVGEHCAPCKVVKPRVRQTATAQGLALTELVVEDPANDEQRLRYGVGSVPTLVVLNGDQPSVYAGMQPIVTALRTLAAPAQ